MMVIDNYRIINVVLVQNNMIIVLELSILIW